jgi:hypothetical protein
MVNGGFVRMVSPLGSNRDMPHVHAEWKSHITTLPLRRPLMFAEHPGKKESFAGSDSDGGSDFPSHPPSAIQYALHR